MAARAIWKGSISFGLVNIPIQVFSATQREDYTSFNHLCYIQVSIAKLDRRDVLRIKDLCKNYDKLQSYSKLIILDGDQQKFKVALENDIGKKLSEHQLHHAANSIRKAKLYIENVLDGKFIPHGSYGINHTKHNLEYGYLIVGLMQPSRKRTMTTTTTKERI